MAGDVFFTTNPADFTKLEGLYVSERNPPGFITGANLSKVGIGGRTLRGPTTPQNIFSAARFLEVYGGRDSDGGALANDVWLALLNKPFGTIAVRRVAAADAVKASLSLEDGIDGTGTLIARVDASSVGTWGNDVAVTVEDASDGDALKWNLRVAFGGNEVLYENLNTQAGQDNLAEVVGSDIARWVDIVKVADGRPANFSTITETDWLANDNADLSMNLGTTLSAYTFVAGSEGTLVATDYTDCVTDLSAFEGVAVVCVVGAGAQGFQTDVNSQIVTEAASATDRVFVTGAEADDNSTAAEIAALAADITTRSDRIIWCYNTPYTKDPETALEVATEPWTWMASILAANDVDIHPGSPQTAAQLAGIKRLEFEALTRSDLIALREAGISTIEKLPGVFRFRSGVTTDLTSGLTEITRRRSADFLQLSAADRLRFYVKQKNTVEIRAQMAGELVAFSQSLKDQSRIVEDFEIDSDSVNTPSQRAQGVEKLLWRVRLIGHILHLVMETEIGTGVVVES